MSSPEYEPIVYRTSEMSGYEFEEAVATLLGRLGYEAEVTARSADAGRDVIARGGGETLVVECKCTRSSVGRPVVQKLHSAAVSFGAETRGIVACTGGFSGPAREHADELGDVVELWDTAHLAALGRRVELYFYADDSARAHIYRPSDSPPEQTERQLRRSFVANLESAPRPADSALSVHAGESDLVAAIRVDYSLDETFGTSTYPNLYRARERGRRLYAPETEVPSHERRLWNRESFDRRCDGDEIDGRPAIAHFDFEIERVERQIARRIAREQSTVVSYTGDNNVTYSKTCEVDPEEVTTRSRRVFLRRRRVRLTAGPSSSLLRVAVPADGPPRLVGSREASIEQMRRIQQGTTALLCNDCGRISTPDRSPERCRDCGRTLCANHHWEVPGLFGFGGEALCSSCYRSSEAPPPAFPAESLPPAVAILVPPLPFAAAGAVGAFVGHLVMLLGAWALLAAGVVEAVQGTPTMAGWLGVPGAVVWGVASGVVLDWWLRHEAHGRNLAELEGYEPAWQSEGS